MLKKKRKKEHNGSQWLTSCHLSTLWFLCWPGARLCSVVSQTRYINRPVVDSEFCLFYSHFHPPFLLVVAVLLLIMLRGARVCSTVHTGNALSPSTQEDSAGTNDLHKLSHQGNNRECESQRRSIESHPDVPAKDYLVSLTFE